MLHLAQVKKKDLEGKVELQLLAQQKAEHAWVTLTDEETSLWVEGIDYNEGAIVLLELSPKRQVEQISDAANWIVQIIDQYLSAGITPAILQEEVQRAEQWRQSLTLQSQELGRRTLEMEARREQIQELEENLKLEKQELEATAAQLKALEARLKQEKVQLESMVAQLKINANGVIEPSLDRDQGGA